MTEAKIQKALFNNFNSHKYRFTNLYFFENESDFLSFLPSGFCYEFEIKISRSDFKADFKKVKHRIHESNKTASKFFIRSKREQLLHNPSWELCKAFPELVDARPYQSYDRHKQQFETKFHLYFNPSTQIDFGSYDNCKLPNKFFYAVPKGLISVDEVPEYAGLVYIDENMKCEKIKDGKFIHKEILDVKRVFNKTYYSYESFLIENFKKI